MVWAKRGYNFPVILYTKTIYKVSSVEVSIAKFGAIFSKGSYSPEGGGRYW